MKMTTRRSFLKQAGAAAVTAALPKQVFPKTIAPDAVPIAVSSANGVAAVSKAIEMIHDGKDALDSVIAGVNTVEDDPNDNSVGYGGLPNEDGVVELDAAVMHGPTHRAGAVASLRNIKNPSKVARLVMERTDHVLLVGEGALRFAKAHGFKEEDLLTDSSREIWLRWKEKRTDDDWLPEYDEKTKGIGGMMESHPRQTGTIHCGALDLKGNMSCVTTTSGLSFKIPGRVGDSPIIGAGLYVDNEVGSAGSTGRGEANLVNCSCVMVVEFMRQGKSPEQACLEICKRIADHNKMARLQMDDGRPNFNVKFYALNKKGEFGAACIINDLKEGEPMYTAHDGTTTKLRPMAYLYKK